MIVRAASAELLAHLALAATTTCRLLKIKNKDGLVFGLATLDVDVAYDDGSGDGVVVYTAANGFDSSAFAADTGFSVQNAEAYALISDEVAGITEAMVKAGVLDDAEWSCVVVNFRDLTMGHMLIGSGDIGDVKVEHGVLFIPELLGIEIRLKQPIGGVWSQRCRAIFGTPADSPTGCGVDLYSLWTYGAVTVVGAENNRTFTIDDVGIPNPLPGIIQFLTGGNAGREHSVESIVASVITLTETTGYPVTTGDTYRIRPDCGKRYLEDCIGIWSNGPNFKGEPHIPIGDGASVQTPGSQVAKKQSKFKGG